MQSPGPHSRESGLIGLAWGPEIYINTQVHLTQGPQDLTSEVTKYSLVSVVETFFLESSVPAQVFTELWFTAVSHYYKVHPVPGIGLFTKKNDPAHRICFTGILILLNLWAYPLSLLPCTTEEKDKFSQNESQSLWFRLRVCFYKYGREMWITATKWFKISWRDLDSWLGLGL